MINNGYESPLGGLNWFRVISALALGCLGAGCGAGQTLLVGPGHPYSTPCQAIAAAPSGATIKIEAAGTYAGDVCSIYQNNLKLIGMNGRPKIDAAGKNAAGKGIWVIDGNDTTVENIEFSGATVPDGNGAGIRFEGVNLTIRNCYFHHNQNGLLTNNNQVGEVVITSSEFAFNGTGNGYTHNIYIGQLAKFTLMYSYSHDAKVGQLVKSRAAENHILYNRLTTESGSTSWELDLPNGGLSYVIGNIIQQGVNQQNSNLVDYMLEGRDPFNSNSQLFVINNTFVNSAKTGTFLNIASINTTPAIIRNNIFYGPGDITTQASAVQSNNFVGDPHFVDAAHYDYRLQSGSPAINAGADPGSGAGHSLTPAAQYVHPTCAQARVNVGSIDTGAYEYGNPGGSINCAPGPAAPNLISLGLAAKITLGGKSNTGTVVLDAPAPGGGLVVQLSSSNATLASVPRSITVAAGNTSAVFTIYTGAVVRSTPVGLSANLGGARKGNVLWVVPAR